MSDKIFKRPAMLGSSHIDADEFEGDVDNIDLIKRRNTHFGGSMLFYDNPAHIVKGEGVWLFDSTGRKYLDCYNNVASVGHCHPHVVKALCDQAGTLNTHTRYLHEDAIRYAERLAGKLPDGLDICFFVCTGTEANELAVRMARAFTKRRGIIVMESAYHGNSTLIGQTSTLTYPAEFRPAHIKAVEPPNTYRGPFKKDNDPGKAYAELVADAAKTLDDRGQGVAAFMCDTIFDSQGALEAPKNYFKEVRKVLNETGGLFIADEVQAGLCRTGKWWGFEHYDVIPDIVTLGKPMGDGHPLAVVVTSREIAKAFADTSIYFNTFGGNPVSMAVGNAVLDVCEDLKLDDHAQKVGAYLRAQLEDLAKTQSLIGTIHGRGLFQNVELVLNQDTLEPATEIARSIPDKMKDNGVLVSLTGRYGNIIKIRPPLVFSKDNADQLISTLSEVLHSCA